MDFLILIIAGGSLIAVIVWIASVTSYGAKERERLRRIGQDRSVANLNDAQIGMALWQAKGRERQRAWRKGQTGGVLGSIRANVNESRKQQLRIEYAATIEKLSQNFDEDEFLNALMDAYDSGWNDGYAIK